MKNEKRKRKPKKEGAENSGTKGGAAGEVERIETAGGRE